jgi:deferrochelatase/peroxidase EfeB
MSGCPFSSRRSLLAAAANVLATPTLAGGAGVQALRASIDDPGTNPMTRARGTDEQIPFHGRRQAGIITPQQTHMLLATFDLVTENASEVIGMLQNWTTAAARMTAGQTAGALGDNSSMPPADSGEAFGLGRGASP